MLSRELGAHNFTAYNDFEIGNVGETCSDSWCPKLTADYYSRSFERGSVVAGEFLPDSACGLPYPSGTSERSVWFFKVGSGEPCRVIAVA